MRKGQKHTPETRQKLRESTLKLWENPEFRKSSSEARVGLPPTNKGKPSEFRGEKHPMFGKHHTPEAIAKMKEGRKRQKPMTEEMRRKMSERFSGEGNPFFGKAHSERSRRKIVEKNTGLKRGPHSLEHRRKISEANKGPTNPAYIDGKSKERQGKRMEEMDGVAYREWRKQVFTRDNYTCQDCGARGVTLHADHVKPWRTHPECRYEVSNGRTLCVPCHRKTPTYGARLDLSQFREAAKQSPEQLKAD